MQKTDPWYGSFLRSRRKHTKILLKIKRSAHDVEKFSGVTFKCYLCAL